MTDIGATPAIAAATLQDVAREAGVSLATASRALNGSSRTVNETLRSRVLEAAASLGYSANSSAQAIARGTTTTVALIVADVADPYFSSIAKGVISEADSQAHNVTMAATDRDPRRELELVRILRGQRPRVMILAGSRPQTDPTAGDLLTELQAYERSGGIVVLISRNDLGFRTVQVDNRAGAASLAVALGDAGYQRFAAIGASEDLVTSSDRLDGFLAGTNQSGGQLRENDIALSPFTRDGGYAGMTRLIESGLEQGSLVFAANDVMAVGALSAARDAGLTPGRDVAIAGFDDIPTVSDVTPSLTTVRVPLEDLGRRALQLALTDTPAGYAETLDTEVILRASTPPR